jgi:condensin complex subunit 2
LNLIEVLDDVIDAQPKESTDVTNFPVAAQILDASVKIYSHRLDSVYQETKTLSAGFHHLHDNGVGDETNKEDQEKTSNAPRKDGDYPEDENEQQDGDEAQQGQQQGNKKKETRKRQVAVSTLQNLENITLEKFDLAFEVDPLFTKTSAQFDEGGARGLLLNHLSVFNDCDIIFDSNDHIRTNPNLQSLTTMLNLAPLSGMFSSFLLALF